MQKKLDSFNKILLATATINYMASSLEGVRSQCVLMNSDIPKDIAANNEKVLSEAVEDLKVIMNKLGDFINATDCICALDQYVTTPAFNVVVNGHDETEGDFDDL